MNGKKNQTLLEGSIIRSIFSLSIPIVFANVLQTAYQLTDTFWVGRLGANAVASISLSFPMIFLAISIGAGFAIAGTVLVAQYTGRQDKENVNYYAAQTFTLMVVSSFVVAAMGYCLSPYIIQWMGASDEVSKNAIEYLQITFIGFIFMYSYFAFQSLMRGVGDVKTPVVIVLSTVLLNLVLDPLFINGWGPIPAYGVKGAALATVGTQGLAAFVGVYLMFSGRYGLHLSVKALKPNLEAMQRIFNLGMPSSIEQSTRALGLMVMTFLVASFGTQVTAIYGVVTRILSFVIIPALGFSMATSTLVAQNIGADKKERAEKVAKVSTSLAFWLLTLVGTIVFLWPKPLISFFIPNDELVIEGGVQFLKILAFSFGLIGVQQVVAGILRGSGNTMLAMVLTIVSLWIFRFPLAYILSKHTRMAELGIWWTFLIGNLLSAIVSWIVLIRGNWKHTQLIKNNLTEQKVSEAILSEETVE